ncbi:D-isomer specific 2-hydroxyacid dehydrogenase family protein [Halocella sp. SP3-1]|uniref:D-isomer specific 2-hydroxyacid dehydrogenase family protein n=1 Tax=Halocella sp. SP3-1 TaxID=2382161 RepID=UPI000F75BFE6|nr:D-isomer specific 2-hydroxyacid dehydrogenase family protein [Halocella sp. SP3-1]AZO94984.1 lactate dehydrogenase [Halocella sp. SP3-1]MTI61256.1 lactate dehydrogenase [Bacillota bacterium]
MNILAYSCREDEIEYFKKFSEKYQVEMKLCEDEPKIENAELAEGCDCISIITSRINQELIEKFHQIGVKFISTRTIGYDHIDIKSAKRYRIGVGNVGYSPASVAEYTVMLILMVLRKMKGIMERSNVQDYSLKGIQGKELHNLTVGIIGTGRIGQRVIKCLSGFACKLLAHDLHPQGNIKESAKYVNLNELFQESDIITMHVPATKENFHLINKESLSIMKDGVYIINTARGSLINTKDLIAALENKKISGAALDVIEGEADLYYNDLKCQVLSNRELAILKSYPNVIITPHTAFYTDQAVSDMVENSILSCISYLKENS